MSHCMDSHVVNEKILGVLKRPFFHAAQDKAFDGKHQRNFAEQAGLDAVEQASATSGRTFTYPADAPSRPCPKTCCAPRTDAVPS